MMQDRSSPSHPPLAFVAGALRSGSTLLGLMLDRHSALRNPGEFDFLFDTFGRDAGAVAAGNLEPAHFEEFLSLDRMYRGYGRPMATEGTPADRVRDYVARLGIPGKLLTVNLHRNFLSAHELFPQARFVHLLRDPRDCAKSSIGMGWAGNVYHGLDPWIEAERSWDRLRPRLAPEQFVEIRFEDMVAKPQEVLTEVCRFLRVAYEPAMLDLTGTTYETPSPRFAGQWRRGMPERDVRLVEARVAELMISRGYERTTDADPPGRLGRLALKAHNSAARHRFRVEHFGFKRWLLDIVSRRLALRGLQRSVRLQLNEIETRNLK